MEGIGGYILLWMDDEGRNRSHRLRPGETVAGRLSNSDPWGVYLRDAEGLVEMGVEDPTVSRVHAVFTLSGGKLTVEDRGTRGEGSRNGTFVNGRRLKPLERFELKPGDEVRLGRYTVIQVGRMENKPTLPVKPGQTIILDASRAETLPQELLRTSIKLSPRKMAVVIDESVPKKSVDLGDMKIRPEYKSDVYRASPVEKLKNLLSSIDSSLAEGLRFVEKGVSKGDRELLVEGVMMISGLLRQKRLAGLELERELEEMGVLEEVKQILGLADMIKKGQAEQPQIERFKVLVLDVQHTVRARLRVL